MNIHDFESLCKWICKSLWNTFMKEICNLDHVSLQTGFSRHREWKWFVHWQVIWTLWQIPFFIISMYLPCISFHSKGSNPKVILFQLPFEKYWKMDTRYKIQNSLFPDIEKWNNHLGFVWVIFVILMTMKCLQYTILTITTNLIV